MDSKIKTVSGEIKAEIEDYVRNHLGLKDKDASKRVGHLTSCAPCGEDYEALEAHLKSLTKKSGANKGQRTYSDSSVTKIIKEYKSYIEHKKGQQTMNINKDMIISQETQEHSDANLTSTSLIENNIASKDIASTVDESSFETADTEQTVQSSVEEHSDTQNTISITPVEKQEVIAEAVDVPPVKEKHKGGRPVSTNRSERFTLYMSADVLKGINTLANLDNLSVTDLMNNLLVSYIDKRRKDIEFMEELERRKADYLQKRVKEE